jgi:hypothetical protein
MLVLQTYIYLRDAELKSFYYESMMEPLWEQVSALTLLAAPADGILPNTSESRSTTGCCSHCCNSSAHKVLNLPPTKNCCVFAALSQADAQKVAGDTLLLTTKSAQGPISAHVVMLQSTRYRRRSNVMPGTTAGRESRLATEPVCDQPHLVSWAAVPPDQPVAQEEPLAPSHELYFLLPQGVQTLSSIPNVSRTDTNVS